MTGSRNRFVAASSIACLSVLMGDFVITMILGLFYSGYHPLIFVMSELGTSESPVALWINLWWIVFGVVFLVFAVGFYKVFQRHKISATVVMLLIMIFGLGAWTCAGLFPMEPGGAETTTAGKLHGLCGGIGYLALLIIPLVSLNIFPRKGNPHMNGLSIGVFILGILFFILFIASEDSSVEKGVLLYAGLWQRLFLLNFYSYPGTIAGLMIRKSAPRAS